MKTTLNLIREHYPCVPSWTKLLRTLGKTKTDDEPISIIQILDSNGLDDAFWCLRAVPNRNKEIRLLAVWCARQVEHLMTDDKSTEALNVAERFANCLATRDELDAARSAASSAAGDAARSARHAARSARSAASSAAGDAAWSAAGDTAGDAAWAAARSAARSARHAASSAAGAEAEAAQEAQLRLICTQIEQGYEK